MKSERLTMKQAAMVTLATVVLVPAWTALSFYDHTINGVDAKIGPLWKHKTIDGVRYTKRKGLVNVFKKWRPLGPATINCLDVYSLYPYSHK